MKTIILAILAAALVACDTMPPVTVIGQFGDYQYSAKGGIVVTPKYPIIIHRDK